MDVRSQLVENRPKLGGGGVALWLLCLVHNRLDERGAAGLLGKLEWAARPNAGLAPFLSGRYCWKLSHLCDFNSSLRRFLMMAQAFALPPQCFAVWRHFPSKPSDACIFFTDAAERGFAGSFRIGIVQTGQPWRSYKAPAWVCTLQQAEFFTVVFAFSLGSCTRLPYVVVGTDSDVSWARVTEVRGDIFLCS